VTTRHSPVSPRSPAPVIHKKATSATDCSLPASIAGCILVKLTETDEDDACRPGRYSRIYPLCSTFATSLLASRHGPLSRDCPKRNGKGSRQTSRSPRPPPLSGALESLHKTLCRATTRPRSVTSLSSTGAHSHLRKQRRRPFNPTAVGTPSKPNAHDYNSNQDSFPVLKGIKATIPRAIRCAETPLRSPSNTTRRLSRRPSAQSSVCRSCVTWSRLIFCYGRYCLLSFCELRRRDCFVHIADDGCIDAALPLNLGCVLRRPFQYAVPSQIKTLAQFLTTRCIHTEDIEHFMVTLTSIDSRWADIRKAYLLTR